MTINFTQIASNIRVPGAYIEFNNTNSAQQSANNQRALLIGQRLASGTVQALTPTLISSKNQAVTSFGRGSMLANMVSSFFDNNSINELWAIALDDDSGGTAATGTITVTGTATGSGTLSLYVNDVLVSASVASGDTPTVAATAMKNAINANLDLPLTATNSAGVITVTYRHKGLVGNKVYMQMNFLGAVGAQALPAGVSVAFAQLSGGATDPDIATVFAALPDEPYKFIAMPYVGSANLTAADTELTSRWSSNRRLGGYMFVAERGSVGTLTTLGTSRNLAYATTMDASLNSPSSPDKWVSALVGQVAASVTVDPSMPLNGLVLKGILPSPPTDRRTMSENNTLLFSGVSSHNVEPDGSVTIQRLITQYQTDGTYLDANTVFILDRMRDDLAARMKLRFSRCKLADNGARIAPNSNVVTPSAIKAEIIALANDWFNAGWMENIDAFKAGLVVERNTNDLSRVDCILTPNLVNGMQVFAAQIKFTI